MKKTEIDYNDVETFPKFAKAAIRIMLEMLRCMMKKKEPLLYAGLSRWCTSIVE